MTAKTNHGEISLKQAEYYIPHLLRGCDIDDLEKQMNQHAPGAKLDQGKNRLGLVLGEFARSLWEVGSVGTFGAAKYSDSGWLQVPDGERRYIDAMMRHLMSDLRGEKLDRESQLPHLAHAAWCCLAVLDLRLRKQEENGTTIERAGNAAP